MQEQQASKQDYTFGIIPPVQPKAPWRVKSVEALEGFCLKITFMDGMEGIADLSALVSSKNAGVFAPLAQPHRFREVMVESGAVRWPEGPDLAPDALYDSISKQGIWIA